MSNGTHLLSFAGVKTEWPVYMTIGNQCLKIRQMPSTHSIRMVTLLPIPIENRNIPQKGLDEQWQTNREVLNKVHRQLLQPLTFKQHPSARSRYYNVLCADGNFRRCELVLAAWLADCSKYSHQHHLQRHVCFSCECPKYDISKMYFSHWEPPGVCERRRSVNLEESISGENQTLGGHSGRPSE